MEKLSELSKPIGVAFKSDIELMQSGRMIHGQMTVWRGCAENQVTEGVYSQEYVSALDKVAQFWIGESAGWKKRAEDAEKRIAELERANTSQDDHINQQQDRIDSLEKKNAGLGRRLGDAEKRLATPVRLPNKSDDEFWFDGVFQVAKFDRAVERAVSAAGFKFVGDE